MKNILLTGGSGFIGQHLVPLLRQHYRLTLVSRLNSLQVARVATVSVDDIGLHTQWELALADQQCVIHLAARAHVLNDKSLDPLTEYRRVNRDGTLNLARQSAAAGVKRFIFISSIGVNGNHNYRPFTEEDLPNPAEPYAQSKWEAEQGLWQIHQQTGMEVVIIRPPLVYGANAPGNFGTMVKWVSKGVPLPFGAVHNQRSLVSVDNLVDLILICISHPQAANQVFLAGDGQDVSTTELLRAVAIAIGKPIHLIPLPVNVLNLAATLLGKKAIAQRLLSSLQVDITKAKTQLNWHPPFTLSESLRRCFERQNEKE